MIIQDDVSLKRIKSRIKGKTYFTYIVSFSTKYADVLSKFEELHNVEVLTDNSKITLPRVKLYAQSYYYRKKTGERIPLISFVFPKQFAEELWQKGVRKLRIIVEVPDLIKS